MNRTLLLLTLLFTGLNSFAQNQTDNPCADQSFLAYVDRPSVGTSPCTVPYKKALLETGISSAYLLGGGTQQLYPQAELRVGLPNNSEILALIPNITQQSVPPYSGLSPTSLGFKHIVGANGNWIATGEAVLTLPSGSVNYGDNGYGATVNGILNYNLNAQWGLTVMLGVSSLTDPVSNGGGRFLSVNPDLILSWSKDKVQLYSEFFGQSKTAHNQNSGFNMDAGVLYLIKPNVMVDFEVGQRLSGTLGGYSHYLGAGMAILFG